MTEKGLSWNLLQELNKRVGLLLDDLDESEEKQPRFDGLRELHERVSRYLAGEEVERISTIQGNSTRGQTMTEQEWEQQEQERLDAIELPVQVEVDGDSYTITLERTETGYSAYCESLPGCVSTGTTREEVIIRNMGEAIELHVFGTLEERVTGIRTMTKEEYEASLGVKVVKLHPEAKEPRYAHPGDAGADLFSVENVVIYPGKWRKVGTGICIQVPSGYEAQIRPRSGLAFQHGITVLNSPGTIDSGYTGEVGVILINHGEKPFSISLGDKIAQLVITPVMRARFEEVDSLDETTRGDGGFGSTGVKG